MGLAGRVKRLVVHEIVASCGLEHARHARVLLRRTDDADAVAAFKCEPRFDVRRTPSQMGMLTEFFRRMKGVHQSLHPTHRVAALGPLAAEMTAGHDRAATRLENGGVAAALAGRAGLDLVCLELGEGVRPDRDASCGTRFDSLLIGCLLALLLSWDLMPRSGR